MRVESGLGRDERGIALAIVVMGVLVIAMFGLLMHKLASSQATQSNLAASEDAVLAAGEAMLDRYAAKLSAEPLYYQLYVDEAEPPRRCADPRSPQFGAVVGPGTGWITGCANWSYEFTNDYYEHPLLNGGAGRFDDIGVLMHVEPPTGAERLSVEIIAKQAERAAQRVIEVEIGPVAASEFLWLVEGDLFFGEDDRTFGKLYAGGSVGFQAGGQAYGDIYAEDQIVGNVKIQNRTYGVPDWKDGAEGWDSTGNHNSMGQFVTDVYPDPLDLDRFWDDLEAAAWAACEGGGICLDRTADPAIPNNVEGYLIETTPDGTKLNISYATSAPKDGSCNTWTKEARWTVASGNAVWVPLGVFEIPRNGVLWADDIVVVGRDSNTPFKLSGGLTIYAGDSSARRNIIVGSDLTYADGLSGVDLLGLIASDEIWLNPNAVGADNHLTMYAATMAQNGQMDVAMSCLSKGRCRTDEAARLTTFGSNAGLSTGNLDRCFVADYNFDDRLTRMRPPFYPLINDQWNFSNWRESLEPCWVEAGGCS